jgi:hypothetical protein
MLRYLVVIAILISVVSGTPVYIAQGDNLRMNMLHSGGTCWYFPDAEVREPLKYYDIPSDADGDLSTCSLTATMTANVPEGTYKFVYTYPLISSTVSIKDISWKNNTLVSIFSDVIPIDESGKQASTAYIDLKTIIAKHGVDGIEDYELTVQPPEVRIQHIDQITDYILRVGGKSNLANNTVLKIAVDPEDHYAMHDLDKFTFYTKINRPYISANGNWETDMMLPLQTMAPGWHNITIYFAGKEQSVRFQLHQAFAPDVPKNTTVNYLDNGNIAPVIVKVTVLQPPEIRYQERWHTATPTPAITDALGSTIDYPYSTGETIPFWVAALAMGIIVVIVMLRGYKWK